MRLEIAERKFGGRLCGQHGIHFSQSRTNSSSDFRTLSPCTDPILKETRMILDFKSPFYLIYWLGNAESHSHLMGLSTVVHRAEIPHADHIKGILPDVGATSHNDAITLKKSLKIVKIIFKSCSRWYSQSEKSKISCWIQFTGKNNWIIILAKSYIIF